MENERSQEFVADNSKGTVMSPDASKEEALVPKQSQEEEKGAVKSQEDLYDGDSDDSASFSMNELKEINTLEIDFKLAQVMCNVMVAPSDSAGGAPYYLH